MSLVDTLFHALLGASFAIAPLGGLAMIALGFGLWRDRNDT